MLRVRIRYSIDLQVELVVIAYDAYGFLPLASQQQIPNHILHMYVSHFLLYIVCTSENIMDTLNPHS